MYNKEWFNNEVTQGLLVDLRKTREICINKLIEAGQKSSDPMVQEHAVSIRTLDTVIREINSKGKTSEENVNEE